MNDAEPIPEEMLSAYLDGELSETEAVRVERQLERDDELRQTLGELTNIREQIKQLPQHTLSSDFAARVTQQLVDQSVVTKQSQPTLPPKPQSNRFKLASVLAAIAALMLISVLSIKYLPGPNVAMNPSELKNDAAPANESQTGIGRGRADSAAAAPIAFDAEDRLLETTSKAAPESAMDLEIASESDSNPLELKSDSYDLIAEYQVDTGQLATLSQSWQQKFNVTEASPRQPNVASFKFEGTYEEISALLGAVQYQASKMEGPAVNEFSQRGLSLKGQRLAIRGMLPDSYNAAPASTGALAAFPDGTRERRSIAIERQSLNKNSVQIPLPTVVDQPSATSVLNQDVADADDEEAEFEKADDNTPTIRILVRFKEVE